MSHPVAFQQFYRLVFQQHENTSWTLRPPEISVNAIPILYWRAYHHIAQPDLRACLDRKSFLPARRTLSVSFCNILELPTSIVQGSLPVLETYRNNDESYFPGVLESNPSYRDIRRQEMFGYSAFPIRTRCLLLIL